MLSHAPAGTFTGTGSSGRAPAQQIKAATANCTTDMPSASLSGPPYCSTMTICRA